MVGIAKIPGEGRGWAARKTHCCPTQMRRSQNWEIEIIRLTLERKNPFHLWSQKYLICSKLILKTLNLLGFLARGPVTATGLFSRELWRTRPFKQFQNTVKRKYADLIIIIIIISFRREAIQYQTTFQTRFNCMFGVFCFVFLWLFIPSLC